MAAEHPIDFMKFIIAVLPKAELLEMSVTHRKLVVVLGKSPGLSETFKLVCLSVVQQQTAVATRDQKDVIQISPKNTCP